VEGRAEALGDAHHLAGAAHLGAQDRVDAGELGEREHRHLDRDVPGDPLDHPEAASFSPAATRAATLANGTPVALATNGTVRDARGLTSSTYRSSPISANCTFMRPMTPSSRAIVRR
jgi:hypothetical protein